MSISTIVKREYREHLASGELPLSELREGEAVKLRINNLDLKMRHTALVLRGSMYFAEFCIEEGDAILAVYFPLRHESSEDFVDFKVKPEQEIYRKGEEGYNKRDEELRGYKK